MIDKNKSARIIKLLIRYYGSAAPALVYTNNYQLTIAVVLSAQTTDIQVNKVTPQLFSLYPDFESLSKAHESKIEKIIQSIGFYHTKAKNIIALSKMIVIKFNGILPCEMESLLMLPGVGRKSANVILSQGFGKAALAVDTHVGRIARRLGYSENMDPSKVEIDLTNCIPRKDWTQAHLLFITHGRKTCTARSPECGACPIFNECSFPDKTC